jgi:hypothetical protein
VPAQWQAGFVAKAGIKSFLIAGGGIIFRPCNGDNSGGQK